MDFTFADLVKFAGQLGAGSTVLLLIAIAGAVRGWWYPGIAYRQLRTDYEKLQQRMDRANDILAQSVEVAKKP